MKFTELREAVLPQPNLSDTGFSEFSRADKDGVSLYTCFGSNAFFALNEERTVCLAEILVGSFFSQTGLQKAIGVLFSLGVYLSWVQVQAK